MRSGAAVVLKTMHPYGDIFSMSTREETSSAVLNAVMLVAFPLVEY